MFDKKFEVFHHVVSSHLGHLKGKKVTEADLDNLVGSLMLEPKLEVPGKLYCRDGFAWINTLDRDSYQIVAFQINSFGTGVFGPDMVKFCTPVLLTVQVQSRYRHAPRSLKHTPITITEFNLGKRYCGSKGNLCDRDKFLSFTRGLLLSDLNRGPFSHHIAYQLMNANYICHHIAETLGYAFGALDMLWTKSLNAFHLSSGSHFSETKDRLFVEIVDNFSGEKMRCYFEVPHYAKLMEDPQKFKEDYDLLLLEVTYRGETEAFYLPVGYQKIMAQRRHENINVVTTQHILQHLMKAYYRRANAFIVASTFQTLEYLSRGFLARAAGQPEECSAFLRQVTTCMGYYPERNFEDFWKKKAETYNAFENEYAHTMFFRAPMLDEF